MFKKILIIISVILLVIGNIYFINKSKKLDYKILIGKPVQGENSDTVGVNFSKSKPLTNKKEYNTIIFSLMNTNDIKETKIYEDMPDSTIWINDTNEDITYYSINLWLKDNFIVIKNENEYKKIDKIYYVTKLKKIIENQMNKYKEIE